ncbi:MAG: enoyl-CoA hydratase/isomerase family protein [Burkholderiales bacterium]|nr:enoyl-CoA hydratase/isomerase family protein [Burkholderiales bacterium]
MATLNVKRVADGVMRVEMARPEVLNAFDEAMIADLEAAFTGAANDAEVRCVVLSGTGRAFCAGADIEWMKRQSEAAESANLEDARRFADMLHALASCPKPTIARVQGACMGGGVGLVCACDFAIASPNARFAVSEALFGILPAVISPYLIAAIGVRRAKQLALSTLRIEATEALAIGLVSKVIPENELDDAVFALARELSAASPGAIAEIKTLYARLGALATPEVRELTAATIARVRGTAEAREGFTAFLEKRPPAWSRDG